MRDGRRLRRPRLAPRSDLRVARVRPGAAPQPIQPRFLRRVDCGLGLFPEDRRALRRPRELGVDELELVLVEVALASGDARQPVDATGVAEASVQLETDASQACLAVVGL